MVQPNRILAALVLVGASCTAQARAPAPMPATMPAALSAPMPAGSLRFRGLTSPGTNPGLDAESRRIDRLIRTAVCTGC